MQTQTGDLAEVWREIRMMWRIIGRLEATAGASNRENDHMRRDMRERNRKKSGGLPLWVHIAGMGLISAMSALGLIKPEVALSIMRMFGKAFAG